MSILDRSLVGLLAVVLASGCFANEASTDAGISLTEAESKLLAIDVAIPICTERFPEAGRDLEKALLEWTEQNAKEAAAFREKLSGKTGLASQVKAKMQAVVEEGVTSKTGDGICRLFASELRQSGPLGRMDFEMAIGFYHQNIVGARVMAEACSRLHPSLAADVERDRRKWAADDADVQGVAIARMEEEMKRPGSPIPAMLVQVERAYASLVDDAERNGNGEYFCRKIFSNFADGSLRRKTPNVYEAILRGPDAK